ncbi:helix-turn-helix domain-containing protein [Pueribacillus sp. YX66]|uniref:helix-turn-helix domain-containing protein n=1 Tax=Pueribacillus sp. YX66 TaxID=3229242 RepID=UPI00358D32B1
MITLTEKQTIIQLHLEEMSKRKIAKKMKKSRNTVAKYIQEFENSKEEDVRNLPFTEEILKPPTYKKRQGKKRVLTENYVAILKKMNGNVSITWESNK